MKIHFNKKEYRLLVETLYLAGWVMGSHKLEPDSLYPEHTQLRKKLLSYYKEMEAENLIEHSLSGDDYYEKADYEDSLHQKFIRDYDNHTFWDELIDRLAVRDLIRKIGAEAYQAMEGIDRLIQLEEITRLYASEFENYGLEHVVVKADKIKQE
jgi:hypothetical protein